jgi:hypothetical protein
MKDRNISATIQADGSITVSGVCMQVDSRGDYTKEIIEKLTGQFQEDAKSRTLFAFFKNGDGTVTDLLRLVDAAVLIERVDLDGDAAIAHGVILTTPRGEFMADLIRMRAHAGEPTGLVFRTVSFGNDAKDALALGILVDRLEENDGQD